MASKTGTATNHEALLDDIISFLTTDTDLVSASQQWQVLKQRRDNLTSITTDLTQSVTSAYRTCLQTFRYEPRSLNTDNENQYAGCFYATNFAEGASYINFTLKATKEIASVKLKSPIYSTANQYMLNNFKLEYSDDEVTWTTALTVNSNDVYTPGQIREFDITGSPGSHIYWRMLLDNSQGSSGHVSWQYLLLLESDGSVANHFGSDVIFKAPGNSGSQEIFTGIRTEYDASNGWYNLFLNGYTGFDDAEESFFNQPGALPGYGETNPLGIPMVPCWDQAMPYWFAASGRSFRFCVKVSTNYEAGYLGLTLPYATPGKIPYPLTVGGSLVPSKSLALRGENWRYSHVSHYHSLFPGPGSDHNATAFTENDTWTTLYQRSNAGEWLAFANRMYNDVIDRVDQGLIAPYVPNGALRSVWPNCMQNQTTIGLLPYRECLGGGYVFDPCILVQREPLPAVLGELEGVFIVSGFNNAPENTTTYDGDDYVILQQSYRTATYEFWALRMD